MSNNRVAKAADQNPQQPGIPAAIATVALTHQDGTPWVLEVDGVLYERPADQARARGSVAASQRWQQIRAMGVPHGLLLEFELHVANTVIEEWQDCMRNIGHVLTYHGQHDLWRLVYLEYTRHNAYALGDETLFLSREPTAGQTGYKGPPTHRFNTAVEQAAQLARGEG